MDSQESEFAYLHIRETLLSETLSVAPRVGAGFINNGVTTNMNGSVAAMMNRFL